MINRSKIENLISKFYAQSLTFDEKIEFEQLLQSSEEVRKSLREADFLDRLMKTVPLYLPENGKKTVETKTKIKRIYAYVVNIAAITLIPLLAISIYLLFGKLKEDQPPKLSQVSCLNGKVVQVKLPDGTNVHLYSESKLLYSSVFEGREREVILDGEATFDVVSDKERPFYVAMANGYRVKAYGTKFNISGYEGDSIISVYLEHGAVDFESEKLESPIILNPSEKINYNRNTNKYQISKELPDSYNARESGILLFRKTPLKDITSKLSKVYNIEIELADPYIGEYPFTATFKDESISQIMAMLQKSSPDICWKKNDSGTKIIIEKK